MTHQIICFLSPWLKFLVYLCSINIYGVSTVSNLCWWESSKMNKLFLTLPCHLEVGQAQGSGVSGTMGAAEGCPGCGWVQRCKEGCLGWTNPQPLKGSSISGYMWQNPGKTMMIILMVSFTYWHLLIFSQTLKNIRLMCFLVSQLAKNKLVQPRRGATSAPWADGGTVSQFRAPDAPANLIITPAFQDI